MCWYIFRPSYVIRNILSMVYTTFVITLLLMRTDLRSLQKYLRGLLSTFPVFNTRKTHLPDDRTIYGMSPFSGPVQTCYLPLSDHTIVISYTFIVIYTIKSNKPLVYFLRKLTV